MADIVAPNAGQWGNKTDLEAASASITIEHTVREHCLLQNAEFVIPSGGSLTLQKQIGGVAGNEVDIVTGATASSGYDGAGIPLQPGDKLIGSGSGAAGRWVVHWVWGRCPRA